MTEDRVGAPVTAPEALSGSHRLSRRLVGGAAAATAVVAFAAGFGLAAIGREAPAPDQVASPTTAVEPTTTAPATTTTTIAIAPAPSIETPTTAETTTTEAPTTTTTQPATTVATTVTTAAPAYVTVDYAATGGRILMRAGSTAQIRFTNVGQGIGQWFIQGAGQVFVVGPTAGTLQAGQTRLVTIQAAPEVPSEGITEEVRVVVTGTGTVVIPVRVVN